jgi:MerR family transcriptional regulator, heat shock protein HspR
MTMSAERDLLTLAEAARAAALEPLVVRLCAESGLIAPAGGYGEAEIAELRRVRRLMDDLGLDAAGVEVALHMRRHMLALQAEIRQLRAELRALHRGARSLDWIDGDWIELG